MKMSAYARAYGLETDPLQETAYIGCGYRRAPRSAAALALAEWTRTDNYDGSAWLPWPDKRWNASLWNHKIIKTALLDTEAGAASLLGFQDQSCLVLLHHPEGGTMWPIPWVFALRASPQDPSLRKIQVRRPSGTKLGQAIFSLQKSDNSWLRLDEQSLSRGLRNAVDAVTQLRAETALIARSAWDGVKPQRPDPKTPWSSDEPMLDFLPFVSWGAEQEHRAEALARDLADWLSITLDRTRFRAISVALRANMPKEAGTDPHLEIRYTTLNGTTVRTPEVQAITHLCDILPPEIASALVAEIGPVKGLDFTHIQNGHRIKGPRLAMAETHVIPSNHRQLALYARFGTPRLPRAA